MFVCAPDDGEASRRAGCLCHTPAFARLNAHLAQKFSRHSSIAAPGAVARRIRRGIGEHVRPRFGGADARASRSPTCGCSTASRTRSWRAYESSIEGKTIKAVEPADAPLDADVRVIDCGGRVSDAGPHRRALARDVGVPAAGRPADGGCRLHQSGRGRRSEKDAHARLHQRSRHGWTDLQPEARDRPRTGAGAAHLAVGRDDLANRRPRRLSLSL